MSTAKFIDIGVNLTDPMYMGVYHDKPKHAADIERVLERAAAAGMESMLVTGGSLEDSKVAIELCKKYDPECKFLFCTVGVHPTRCMDFVNDPKGAEEHMNGLRAIIAANRDRVAAIGEFGLDYERVEFCPVDVQKLHFEMQLQLVEEFKLPMFLHMRAAGDDFCDIMSRNRAKWEGVEGVSHSFTGTIEEAHKISSLGLCIGVNGCSLKTEENLAAVKEIPERCLLLETDAPWCDIRPTHASYKYVKTEVKDAVKKPEKHNPLLQVKGRNEPCNIVQVAEVAFGVRQPAVDFAEFCSRVYQNTIRVFPKLARHL